MMEHVEDTLLALYVSGDLPLFRRASVRLHVGRCNRCRRRVERHRLDLAAVRETANHLPEGVDWSRLAPEMMANIHVGLAAGECVAPRQKKSFDTVWRPVAVAAALALLLTGAWWLNAPNNATASPVQGQALTHPFRGGWTSVPRRISERGPVVEATADGIELRENGSSLGIAQGTGQPLTVSMSVQGSASARYVDLDTGQMTITSVYVQ